MRALGEHAHRELAHEVAAQRGGTPELLVVAAFRIQTHHQRGLADTRAERIEVRRQVDTAAFLRCLDHQHTAGEWNFLRLEGGDGGQ
jgi:hypothetical protein